MLDRSPMRILALNQLVQQFGDLLSVRSKTGVIEKSLIEGTYDLLLINSDSLPKDMDWPKTTRAAFYLLEKGFLTEPQKIAKVFVNVIEYIPIVLNTTFHKRRESQNEDDIDKKLVKYLAYYKTMYEGLIPLLMAPIVYAFSIYKGINDNDFKPRNDGRINTKAINKMEKLLGHPQNRLAIGLNSHIRNAYSHESYRILDDGKVELWDMDPHRPKKKWGPEIWTLSSLEKLCNELWFNSLSVVLSHAIFSINNNSLIMARGWGYPDNIIHLRREELKYLIKVLAHESSFNLKDLKIIKSELNIKLRTELKGIDQEEEIIVGYKTGHPRIYKIQVIYEEVRIIEMLFGLFQEVGPSITEMDKLSVIIKDHEENAVGRAEIFIKDIVKIKGPGKSNIETDRGLLQIDTLGDSMMYVRREGHPIEI